MSEKLKMALLGLIAVALVVIAYSLVTDNSGPTTIPRNTVADNNTPSTTPATRTPAANVADPMNTTPAAAGPSTTVAFEEMVHDFGTITQDSENTQIFKFTNTGTEPLIIENAKGSCGCTVPQYPRNPVAPGESGEITVVYKPGKQKNQQTKTITITANTEPKNTLLTIKANVLEA